MSYHVHWHREKLTNETNLELFHLEFHWFGISSSFMGKLQNIEATQRVCGPTHWQIVFAHAKSEKIFSMQPMHVPDCLSTLFASPSITNVTQKTGRTSTWDWWLQRKWCPWWSVQAPVLGTATYSAIHAISSSMSFPHVQDIKNDQPQEVCPLQNQPVP